MVRLEDFLLKVREIDKEHPAYRPGGDGSDGTCDCIGLVIGAIRRAGGRWTGTHGSNYAVRFEVDGLRRVSGADELREGDLVFKALSPGETGYALPPAYARHADRRDYYHVGIVMNTSPLDICHCTTPTTAHDARLGRWAFAARLLKVADDTKGEENGMDALYQAVVATHSGSLNIRSAPGMSGAVRQKAPKGALVDVLEEGEWMRVRYGGVEGYASGEYLRRAGAQDDGGTDDGVPGDGARGDGVPGDARALTLIDDAGNTFFPVGGFRVLMGGRD